MRKGTVIAGLAPAAVGLLVSAVCWSQVPDPMPTHWDANGDPNGWMSRTAGLLFTPLISVAVAAIVAWAMRKARASNKVAMGVMLGVGGFHVGLHALIVHAALQPAAAISMTGMLVLIGALISGMGVAMPHIEQNKWAGVRTPWTLADEVNWDLTHRFAGWSMGISGVVCVALAAVLSPPASFWLGVGAIIVGALLPVVYSYVIHRMRS